MVEIEPVSSFRFFDPSEEFGVTERQLPHWAQAKTLCFITWRTWDSLPAAALVVWHAKRKNWLGQHKIDSRIGHWMAQLRNLPPDVQREYHRLFPARWEALLDDCHGLCPLRQPALGKIVAGSLQHFNDVRYFLTDYVVMPNHVHLLAAFDDPEQMLKQCDSWKHFTATHLNKELGRKGRFWEPDAFDHLVRSEEQWLYLRQYILDNPIRAKLRSEEYIHYSRVI